MFEICEGKILHMEEEQRVNKQWSCADVTRSLYVWVCIIESTYQGSQKLQCMSRG